MKIIRTKLEHINKKEWDDMGSDFSALKKYLPKPHPELEKTLVDFSYSYLVI